jgi:hypothetical protein
MAFAQLPVWARTNPNQVIAMALATLVIGASAWVGIKARGVSSQLADKRLGWEQSANQLATVRQQFRAPTSTESAALIAESSQMGSLGVAPADKISLVDMVGRLAEACALTGVRVNSVAPSDSAFIPERDISGTRIAPADYALVVEFAGSFANAQKFVSSLPPSVSLYRLSAGRREVGASYRLILSVYQLDANPGN